MCASKVAEGGERGWIIPIGGAEEKENAPQILKRFVQLAGGDRADIVVIPTASQMRDTGVRYERTSPPADGPEGSADRPKRRRG